MGVYQAIERFRTAARDALESAHRLAALVPDDQALARELLKIIRLQRLREPHAGPTPRRSASCSLMVSEPTRKSRPPPLTRLRLTWSAGRLPGKPLPAQMRRPS